MIKLTLETAKLMYESSNPAIKQFALDNYSELGRSIPVGCWEDLENISGFYVNSYSTIHEESVSTVDRGNKNIFATREQAEASLALAQLSQLMEQVDGTWIPDYTDESRKYAIVYDNEKITSCTTRYIRRFLTFRSEKIRDEFLLNHRDLIEIAKPLL